MSTRHNQGLDKPGRGTIIPSCMVVAVVLIGLGLILTQTAGALGLLWYARREYLRERQALVEQITTFVSAPTEGGSSPLAELVELVASRFSHQFMTLAKAQIAGDRGHIGRQETALQVDILQDAATAKSPLLGLLAGAFPSVTRRLAKNPSALPALMNLLNGMGSGSGQLPMFGPGSNGSREGSVLDRLKKQA